MTVPNDVDADVEFGLLPGDEVLVQAAQELAATAPSGWERLDAIFAFTTTAEISDVTVTMSDRVVGLPVPEPVLDVLRAHRAAAAGTDPGPWWRLALSVLVDDAVDIAFDYGADPFPPEHLFAPQAYAADVADYPRAQLPVWLAAYLRHDGRQARPAQRAAAAAHEDRRRGIVAVPVDGLPALPVLWSRWAVLAAAFTAAGAPLGPRIMPGLATFDGAARSGAALYRLPGNRAVLSGGTWDAPMLDAVYNDGAAMPAFYRGAPAWVSDDVLTVRAQRGLLSFCYWWDRDGWYCGQSPPIADVVDALPAVRSADALLDVLAVVLGDVDRDAARRLLAAAAAGAVTRHAASTVFADADAALAQLDLAGAVLPELPVSQAVYRVAQVVARDEPDFPSQDLRADRLDTGWLVYLPSGPGDVVIGRTIFYVADDGVVEESSSPPSRHVPGFARRFQERMAAR